MQKVELVHNCSIDKESCECHTGSYVFILTDVFRAIVIASSFFLMFGHCCQHLHYSQCSLITRNAHRWGLSAQWLMLVTLVIRVILAVIINCLACFMCCQLHTS